MACSVTKKVAFFLVTSVILTASTLASPPRSRGARPIALGNGYAAVAGDSYSLFYNPGGLAEIAQKEFVIDYGRSTSIGEFARTDFNAIYSIPYRYKDKYVPLAFGVYGEGAAPGAHIVDITAGGGTDAPVDQWTKGFIKWPVKLGAAVTIRQQGGETRTTRVGKSSIGLGLTGGAYVPLNRKTQFGFTLRDLFPGGANPEGPSLHIGAAHIHKDYLNMFGELSFASGGIWRFHPGLEWLVARGVVRPRLGWGFRDNGAVDSVATGIGFYLSPMQIDLAYLIPTKTLNDNTSQFRASLVYRFGRPQFSEIYYDRALEAAGKLDTQVLTLTVKEAELKASLAELEQKKRLAADEILDMKKRIQELKDKDLIGERDQKIRQLQYRVQALESELDVYKSRQRAAVQRANTIRKHTVKAGDTLQSLAREYYGDPNQWKKIYNANMEKIERGLPKVGSELVIP